MTIWLNHRIVLDIHEVQLREHGGAAGLRDEGLLESALARPLNLAAYGKSDTAELAACYALAIGRNHPSIDGNKRTGFMCMALFLSQNGLELEAPMVEATMTTLSMAAGDLPDDEFTAWIRRHATPRG